MGSASAWSMWARRLRGPRGAIPFVHSMKEQKELIAEIGKPNVGLLLDSWHWYTAGESAADLRTLTNKDIVSVDLNDAPAGVALDQQKDNKRDLPAATGTIDIGVFLNTLNELRMRRAGALRALQRGSAEDAA